MPPFLFGYDFYYLWAVGALLHHGENPYDVGLLHQHLDSIGWPASENPQPFTHPVNALWLYWLFALMPFKVALTVWSVASIALVVGCCRVVAPLVGLRRDLSTALVLFVAMLFPPTLGNLIWGQVNALLVLGISLYGVMSGRRRYFAAGLGLSLLLLKPHNFIPFLVVILVFELREGRLGTLVGCAMGGLLQIFASWIIAPEGVTWYRGAIEGVMSTSLSLRGATIGQLLENVWGLTLLRPSLVLLGSLAALWIVHRRGYSLRTLLGTVLPLSICVSPYCWMHTFVVLLPSVLLMLDEARTRFSEAALRYCVTGLAALSLPLIVNGTAQAVWVLLSWALLFGAAFLTSPTVQGERCAPL